MSEHAISLAIEQAEAGMVLAADLKDAAGSVLLPAGTPLSAANLASLRRRGIQACRVLAQADPARRSTDAADAATAEAEHGRRQRRLARLFRVSAGEQATPLLLQLLVHYRQNG